MESSTTTRREKRLALIYYHLNITVINTDNIGIGTLNLLTAETNHSIYSQNLTFEKTFRFGRFSIWTCISRLFFAGKQTVSLLGIMPHK